MRNPNGYGAVYKISGKRRRPFAVRLTIGWTDEGKQLYEYLGYYKTRKEALMALAEYNKQPYSLEGNKMTFHEVYEKWVEDRFPKLSQSSRYGYSSAFKFCSQIYEVKFVDVRKHHLQGILDHCDRGYATKRKIKVLCNQIYKFAMENDIVSKDYSRFMEVGPTIMKRERRPFSDNEIQDIWHIVEQDSDDYSQMILMLLYSGVRIGELLDLKKENVHLDEQYFNVTLSKTSNGIRQVPIATKTLPFFKNWMSKRPKFEYLLFTRDGRHMTYDHYRMFFWNPFMEKYQIYHRPHETRYTTISLLARADVNQTVIKRIVGHSGAMSLTEKVYTHFPVEDLVSAINRI